LIEAHPDHAVGVSNLVSPFQVAPEPRVIWWLDQPILGQCCAMLHPSTLWVVVSPDLHCMIISGTISSPTTFPQNKTCAGAPSGCQLQSSAAPASDPGK